jgi:hypothetical protein
MAQPAFGNVLFDVHPLCADVDRPTPSSTPCSRCSPSRDPSADTPLESDDAWRRRTAGASGFDPTGDDVVPPAERRPAAYRVDEAPVDVTVTSNTDDLDAYVVAHRAAFGTTYLTRARREAWSATEGYDPAYDLASDVDGSWRRSRSRTCAMARPRVGVVGVVPDHRARGLARLAVGLVLASLVAAGASLCVGCRPRRRTPRCWRWLGRPASTSSAGPRGGGERCDSVARPGAGQVSRGVRRTAVARSG